MKGKVSGKKTAETAQISTNGGEGIKPLSPVGRVGFMGVTRDLIKQNIGGIE
jgi:hypothetical protein